MIAKNDSTQRIHTISPLCTRLPHTLPPFQYTQGEWEETLSAFSNRPMETLIFVNSAGIKGSLTPEEGVPPACSLAQKSLKVLDLYNNTIQGSIPDCILNGTSKLQYIRLGMCALLGGCVCVVGGWGE